MSATVHFVDDDAAVLISLTWLFAAAELATETYANAEEFIARYQPAAGDECLVLDLCMPGVRGLPLFESFAARGWTMPVIFLTGQAKVTDAVAALKRGAFDFLEKPLSGERLLTRVQEALAEDRRRRERSEEVATSAARLASLTQRELQVAMRVAAGLANKVIAAELGISPRTVEVYRAKAMSKTGARSVADLVQLIMRQPQAS